MRTILYPFFLLCLVAAVFYFFGADLSPFMQTVLLVLGVAFAFFLFRGLFLFFFDWIFESFSALFKTFISAILFILLLFGLWGAFPQDIREKVESLFVRDGGVTEELSSFTNGVTEKISDAGKNVSENLSENIQEVTVSGVDTDNENQENTEETGESENTADGRDDRKPVHLLKNINTAVADENTAENEAAYDDEQADAKSTSTWSKPVVVYGEESGNANADTQADEAETQHSSAQNNTETQDSEASIEGDEKRDEEDEKLAELVESGASADILEARQKANESVAQMKKSGVQLVGSGPSADEYTVVFREVDAQVVFPVEYTVSQVLWTDTPDTRDRVDFTLQTPSDTRADISIALFDSGENFEKYFDVFLEPLETGNRFVVTNQTENTLTYGTFFEGIFWEIDITLEGENLTAEDFYQILLPISFQK